MQGNIDSLLQLKSRMIGALLQTILLLLNAAAILNQKRFLKKYGFDTASADPNNPNEVIASKSKIIMFVFTIRSVGKYVLIPLNIIAIILQLFG